MNKRFTIQNVILKENNRVLLEIEKEIFGFYITKNPIIIVYIICLCSNIISLAPLL